MSADEARTVRDLKEHQVVVLPMIGQFGGRIIDAEPKIPGAVIPRRVFTQPRSILLKNDFDFALPYGDA